ncbi:MAG: FadR family transcriptional regulator [Desulfobacteraceae bacterium]|nr:FadR family transcriptional regulator [Desulfobacteraceae bacterium]
MNQFDFYDAFTHVESKMKPYRYEAIVQQIQELISQGRLSVGDKLPPERTLAKRFKVSRNSVRQAVQALAEKNLVESRQGDGTYICGKDNAHFVDSLARAIGAEKSRLKEILEFRQCLEPQIARLAASAISQAQLNRLKIIVCDQERKLLANQEDDRLDQEFHSLLARASGNTVMQEVFTALTNLLNESRSEFLQSNTRRKVSITGHLKIIDGLENRNPAMARQAMEEHIMDVEQTVLT